MTQNIHIIGAGLAGSEAAWQIAESGHAVTVHEMRPTKMTPAHKTGNAAELVCSNSFRSDDYEHNAVGLLHEEMRRLGSLIMREGDKAKVPAGGALAVDRDIFSNGVTDALKNHPNITIEYGEITDIPDDWDHVIIATGPLTSDTLATQIATMTGSDALAFYDALAPIVHHDSIDMSKAWYQSRYDKGDGKDYINCPMTKDQYFTFVEDLLNAEYGAFKDWELGTCGTLDDDTPYFDGCMPVEEMARRGAETLRFGPMKPVGLTNPHDPANKPYAIVQLRQDNKLGTLWNMVGFQTKMKWGEQTRVFKTIPGLENASFARLGGLHRNTFINAPSLLDETLRLKSKPRVRFAGQITGCEGYIESAAVGLMAGRFTVSDITGQTSLIPPSTTAHGAILNHITGGADAKSYQPMNVNFGLFPPLSDDLAFQITAKGKKRRLKGTDKKKVVTSRALNDLKSWMSSHKKAA